jgi:D-inositol-3-phosphate glycosyltransferase
MMGKIGFIICSTGWGGLEINVLRLIKWLNERNLDITLFVTKDTKLYTAAQESLLNTVVINNHKKYFDFKEAYRFSRELKQHSIDTLFVCDNRDLDLAFLSKKMLRKKLKIVYHQQMQIGVGKKDIIHTMRFSSIDHWISPLELLKKEVLEKTRVKAEKIAVIPLCIEIEKFITPKYTKAEARGKLALAESDFIVGIIGRIDPLKGQLFLVKAIQKLNQKNVNIKLLIVGEPTVNDSNSKKYFVDMQQYIEAQQLSEIVQIRSFTNDVSVFYNAVDVFALASEGETFGMVTIEAMLSQLPIIATNSGGTPEILNYGELGLLYAPQNTDEFCEKLQWMKQNQDKCLEMSVKARETAKSKYSHLRECELIEKLIK